MIYSYRMLLGNFHFLSQLIVELSLISGIAPCLLKFSLSKEIMGECIIDIYIEYENVIRLSVLCIDLEYFFFILITLL